MICVDTIHHSLRQSLQGVAKRNLEPTDKRPFFITLRRLTERHKLLPDRVKIKGSIEVLDKLLGSGGLADVKSGTYEGRPVAVRIMRISVKDDFARKRKVRINAGHQEPGLSHLIPGILQRSHPLERAISPQRLETCRGPGGHIQTAAHYRVRVDEPWEHHGIH